MPTDDSEEELRRRFHELRRHTGATAPACDRLLRAPGGRVRVAWFRSAEALALIVLCVGVTLLLAQKRQPEMDLQACARLTQWQAATDVLLTASGTPWGSDLDTPTDLWIESTLGRVAASQTKEEHI